MGNWNISIRGVGSHNNGDATDADTMAAEFVKKLSAAGHSVRLAQFITGADYELERPDEYIESQKRMAEIRKRQG